MASICGRSICAFRSMWVASHGANESPSPKPAYTAYSRCEWALTIPGTIAPSAK